jgi:K+-transporting ATPase KdpF subunit
VKGMSLGNIIMLAICFLLLIYLGYALLRPEKF